MYRLTSNYILDLSEIKGPTFIETAWVHMTKMAAMVIYGKTFTRNRMTIISFNPSIEIHFIFYLQLKCQAL